MKPGALFDWDGGVIDSSKQHEESWELQAAELGKPLPDDHFLRGFGMKNQVINPRILGRTEDPDEIHRYSLRKEELYRDIVRERGIEAIFDSIGVREYFTAVVTAEGVFQGKPDPQCRRLRCAGP